MQEEVKLAKWDEQTYYARAESSERNHRKLMRILREYDEVLDLNVTALLEDELCRGVRLVPSSKSEAASNIPSDDFLFTFRLNDENIVVRRPEESSDVSTDRDWTDVSTIGLTEDNYASRIGRYAKKMTSLSMNLSGGSSALGSSAASDLCTSIFDRIESLRSENSTRPMKERALVDLFKELKCQGYSATKWSVPNQVRQMGDLFQLPFPVSADLDPSVLRSAELYYQRSLSELFRLRSEISMLGSEHMTMRQLTMMLGFGDHGLLLLVQQRSILSSVLLHRKDISEQVDSILSSDKQLPLPQSKHHAILLRFNTEYAHAVESLRQLILLVKTSKHMLSGERKIEWSRNTITNLESLLAGAPQCSTRPAAIVSAVQLREIERMREFLVSVSSLLRDCREGCADLECLPLSSFETCFTQLNNAITSSQFCCDTPVEDPKGDEGTMLRSFAERSSNAVHATLQAVQVCSKDNKSKMASSDDDHDESIWHLHRSAANSWASINLRKLALQLDSLVEESFIIA